MKRKTGQWVRKAEADFAAANGLARERPPPRDIVCFHCQQAAEKYIKAVIQERGSPVPKTHDLDHLVEELLPSEPFLKKVHRAAASLTRYAVDYRYPDYSATTRQMNAALRAATRIRAEIRGKLGLPAE